MSRPGNTLNALPFEVEKPVALVTGSAKDRVGRAIARRLAKAGVRLAIHGHQSAIAGRELIGELGKKVQAELFLKDLTNPDAGGELVEEVHQRFGRIDILVNSAAIWYPTPLEQVEHSELEKFIQINTLASFSIARECGLRMEPQQRGGVIINIGDWAPMRPYRDYPAYFLSKGSIPTLTRMLAVELAERNSHIRVNAVLPGPVMIPPDMDTEMREKIIDATLLKREGTPEHVADACFFLIQNDFVTGVCLPVDGGRSIYSPHNPV